MREEITILLPEIKLETTSCTKKSTGACQHVIKKYYCAKNPTVKIVLINLSFQYKYILKIRPSYKMPITTNICRQLLSFSRQSNMSNIRLMSGISYDYKALNVTVPSPYVVSVEMNRPAKIKDEQRDVDRNG